MPGGAAGAYRALDPSLSASELERLLALEGLDRPIHERYRCWLFGRAASGCRVWPGGGILRGDLGFSRVHQRPVAVLLADRLLHTLRLMMPALLIALLGATVAGVWAAQFEGRWPDKVIGAASILGQSTPVQWGALMAILIGAIYLRAFPPGGIAGVDDNSWLRHMHHAALPVLVLAAYYGAFWTRYLRLELLAVLRRPFVTAARAKGLTSREVWRRHVLPNALVPMVTSVSLMLPAVFSGVLVVEQVFSYPGMGLLMFESIREQDPLTAMVVFLLYAGLAMLATALSDLCVRWLNPALGARASR